MACPIFCFILLATSLFAITGVNEEHRVEHFVGQYLYMGIDDTQWLAIKKRPGLAMSNMYFTVWLLVPESWVSFCTRQEPLAAASGPLSPLLHKPFFRSEECFTVASEESIKEDIVKNVKELSKIRF
jgi:hypothetical protein